MLSAAPVSVVRASSLSAQRATNGSGTVSRRIPFCACSSETSLPDLDLEEYVVRVIMAPPKILSLLDDFHPPKIAIFPVLFP